MSERIKIANTLTNVHVVEVSDSLGGHDGRIHELLEVPVFPGGFFRAQFDFESRLNDGGRWVRPAFDLVWRVEGDNQRYETGAMITNYRYVMVKSFDPATGEGVAIIDMPFLGNDLGFPSFFPGANTLTISVGLEGELSWCGGELKGVESTFSSLTVKGTLPEYAVNILTPNLNLQEQCESSIVIYAREASNADREVRLDMRFQPKDPAGVVYPEFIRIPAGQRIGEGTLQYNVVASGNDAATGILDGTIHGVTYRSGLIEFNNELRFLDQTTFTQFESCVDSWAYCERNAQPSLRAAGVRREPGPCEGGLVFHTCDQGVYGYYVPYRCAFSFRSDCSITQTTLKTPGWQFSHSTFEKCLRYVYDRRTGRWTFESGNRRVCFYVPTGQNVTITVDDCKTV